jgi:hypothetical protein
VTASRYAHRLRDRQRAHGVYSSRSRKDYRQNQLPRGRKGKK